MDRLTGVIIVCFMGLITIGCRPDLDTIRNKSEKVSSIPSIMPEYIGITIPPNIAPLNFSVQDSCTDCIAELSSVSGVPIVVRGEKNGVRIDQNEWKKLLALNTGKPLRITVYTKKRTGQWKKYADIVNTIATEPVDEYCTYRLLNFQYNFWNDLRECQRNLTSYEEKAFVNSQNYRVKSALETKCMNCHMPFKNNSDRFVLQIRSIKNKAETIIADGDSITVVSSKLGYPAWHPGGNLIAFSVYKVQQYFHSVGSQFIDVFDNGSDVVIYDHVNRSIIPLPQLSQDNTLETWPAWSSDGKYLYYCSAPVPWADQNKEPPDNFNKTRYSLLRISFDSTTRSFGPIDTVLSSLQIGLSIAQPRISPDNRFCIFSMQDYGAYPHSNATSDLYILDMQTMQYSKMPVNSAYNESWHSWSKNSRWILFSSKRGGGLLTRLYIAHIDSSGNASKPFVLPQEAPDFYNSFTKCYNVAEFADAPIRFSEREMDKAIFKRTPVKVDLPKTNTVLKNLTNQDIR
ncbi:MAG: TolB family protein [Fibrobacterota bacterium]|nr:hypothetical protein [Chitinispirillaceae bacterium]